MEQIENIFYELGLDPYEVMEARRELERLIRLSDNGSVEGVKVA